MGISIFLAIQYYTTITHDEFHRAVTIYLLGPPDLYTSHDGSHVRGCVGECVGP